MVYWTLAYWTLNCFRKLAAESNVSAFGLLCHIRQVILPCKRNDWITVARQGLGIRSSLPSPTYYHRTTHLDVCILLHYVTSSFVVGGGGGGRGGFHTELRSGSPSIFAPLPPGIVTTSSSRSCKHPVQVAEDIIPLVLDAMIWTTPAQCSPNMTRTWSPASRNKRISINSTSNNNETIAYKRGL